MAIKMLFGIPFRVPHRIYSSRECFHGFYIVVEEKTSPVGFSDVQTQVHLIDQQYSNSDLFLSFFDFQFRKRKLLLISFKYEKKKEIFWTKYRHKKLKACMPWSVNHHKVIFGYVSFQFAIGIIETELCEYLALCAGGGLKTQPTRHECDVTVMMYENKLYVKMGESKNMADGFEEP